MRLMEQIDLYGATGIRGLRHRGTGTNHRKIAEKARHCTSTGVDGERDMTTTESGLNRPTHSGGALSRRAQATLVPIGEAFDLDEKIASYAGGNGRHRRRGICHHVGEVRCGHRGRAVGEVHDLRLEKGLTSMSRRRPPGSGIDIDPAMLGVGYPVLPGKQVLLDDRRCMPKSAAAPTRMGAAYPHKGRDMPADLVGNGLPERLDVSRLPAGPVTPLKLPFRVTRIDSRRVTSRLGRAPSMQPQAHMRRGAQDPGRRGQIRLYITQTGASEPSALMRRRGDSGYR